MLDRMTQNVRGVVTAAFAFVLLGISVSADAASYRTRFDPQFSTGFLGAYTVDLWWQGTAKITVPDACVSPLGSCSSGITLDDYLVEFYDGQPPPDGSGSLLASAFPGSLPAPTLVTFDASGIANGMDLELDLGVFVLGSGTFDAVLSFATQYSGDTPITGSTSLILYPCTDRECEPLTNEFLPTITWVPEPATGALAGIALMGMWLARRRSAAKRLPA